MHFLLTYSLCSVSEEMSGGGSNRKFSVGANPGHVGRWNMRRNEMSIKRKCPRPLLGRRAR